MSAIQIKDVPAELHERLRERAREQGQSLSQYALGVIQRDLALPSTRDWLRQIAEDDPVGGVSSEEIVDLIREGRAERDDQRPRALADRD
jgi:hypothetical protein